MGVQGGLPPLRTLQSIRRERKKKVTDDNIVMPVLQKVQMLEGSKQQRCRKEAHQLSPSWNQKMKCLLGFEFSLESREVEITQTLLEGRVFHTERTA